MSSFGTRRKARIIQTLDDEGDDSKSLLNSGDEEQSDRKSQALAKQLSEPPLLIINHQEQTS